MLRNIVFSAALALTAVIAAPASALVIINSPTAGQTYNDDVDVVTGGEVTGNLGLNGFGYTIRMMDGLITGNLATVNGFEHKVIMTGGTVNGDIFFNGFDHVLELSGGTIGGDVFTNGFDSIFNIYGRDLTMTGDFNDPLGGATVTGFLSDGTAINTVFRSNGDGHVLNLINEVPEPGMIGLLGLGLIGLGAARRRKA